MSDPDLIPGGRRMSEPEPLPAEAVCWCKRCARWAWHPANPPGAYDGQIVVSPRGYYHLLIGGRGGTETVCHQNAANWPRVQEEDEA
jgi:hypothetical protein